MIIIKSHNQVPVRLTDERWKHIVLRHPEMDEQRERVLETLGKPDIIQRGDFGELLALRFFKQTPLTSKFLVVVYKEVSLEDGFILTAYCASRPAAGRQTIWKQ